MLCYFSLFIGILYQRQRHWYFQFMVDSWENKDEDDDWKDASHNMRNGYFWPSLLEFTEYPRWSMVLTAIKLLLGNKKIRKPLRYYPKSDCNLWLMLFANNPDHTPIWRGYQCELGVYTSANQPTSGGSCDNHLLYFPQTPILGSRTTSIYHELTVNLRVYFYYQFSSDWFLCI